MLGPLFRRPSLRVRGFSRRMTLQLTTASIFDALVVGLSPDVSLDDKNFCPGIAACLSGWRTGTAWSALWFRVVRAVPTLFAASIFAPRSQP